jgi:hypothetical protein
VTDGVANPEGANSSSAQRRRLKVIVSVGLFAVLAFALTTIYSERKVNDENRRVQRLAPAVTVTEQDILDDAFTSSNKIADEFGVAGDRVSVTIGGGVPCIAIRSEFITSSRSSAFVVQDGSLTPTDHC